MKRANIILICGIMISVIAPGVSFAQTAPMTIVEPTERLAQLQLLLQLLQQLQVLQAKLAALQGQQTTIVPAVTVQPPIVDASAPIISNVSATSTQTSMTVQWMTNKETKSVFSYWAPYFSGFVTRSIANEEWKKSHSQVIKNLEPGTIYHVRITAIDKFGHSVVYPDQIVKTVDLPDKTKPTHSNILISNIGRTSALVSWTTDENAKGKIYYGITDPLKMTDKTTFSASDTSFGVSHVFFLSNLQPGTTYYYIIESIDAAGNKRVEEQRKFTTAR